MPLCIDRHGPHLTVQKYVNRFHITICYFCMKSGCCNYFLPHIITLYLLFLLFFHRILTAPVCAAVEVYLLNKELWSSQIPRINALMVSVISITLFPLWYFFFLAALLASVYDSEGTKTSRRDKRIIYDSQKDTKFPLQKHLMAIVFVIFSPAWFLCFCDTGKFAVTFTIMLLLFFSFL